MQTKVVNFSFEGQAVQIIGILLCCIVIHTDNQQLNIIAVDPL